MSIRWVAPGCRSAAAVARPPPRTIPFTRTLTLTNGGAQVLVCGRADRRDSYACRCAVQMRQLREAYPRHFWADPDTYFEDADLASIGADFGETSPPTPGIRPPTPNPATPSPSLAPHPHLRQA